MLTNTTVLIYAITLGLCIGAFYLYFFHNPKRTLSYGDNARQTMDLYLPHRAVTKNTLLVFVYGGAWRTGSKNYYRYVGTYFARRGYTTLIPDYRVYPDVQFPEFIDDIALAIKTLEKSNLATYEKIILVGHSAGAHTAAMLVVDPSYFTRFNIETPIESFIGLSGPYDLPFDAELTPIFETAINERDKTNPVTLSKNVPHLPPITLIHGREDTRVNIFHSERFATALSQRNVDAKLHILDHYSHADTILSLLPFINIFTQVPKILRDRL